jgi:hypothetical protein
VDVMIEALCRLPIDFHEQMDVSALDLVRRSGYPSRPGSVSAPTIADCLARHPDWVEAWFVWSGDIRGSPSWWLDRNEAGEYLVGRYDPTLRRQAPPLVVGDKVRACAEFVSRYVESVANLDR